MKFLFVATFIAVIFGCSVNSVFYHEIDGATAADLKAVLFVSKNDNMNVAIVDDTFLSDWSTAWNGYSAFREVHIKPGEHSVSGSVVIGGNRFEYKFRYNFLAGKRYRIEAKASGYNVTVEPVEVDE